MEHYDINVYPSRKKHNVQLVVSGLDFFNEMVIVTITHEKITFAKPTIDYSGKLHLPNKLRRSKNKSITISNKDLPLGGVNIDEDESNEDRIVIYFEDIQPHRNEIAGN